MASPEPYYIAAATWLVDSEVTGSKIRHIELFNGPMVPGLSIESLVTARVLEHNRGAKAIAVVHYHGVALVNLVARILGVSLTDDGDVDGGGIAGGAADG